MSLLSNHLQVLCVLVLVVPFLPITTHGYNSVLYQKCAKNFTENYTMQTIIHSLVTDMKDRASISRFAISSTGIGDDVVYGVARCQGDMSREECSACITDMAEKILTKCPDLAETRVWSEKCFLRYDTSNFIGKPDLSYAAVWMSYYEAENAKAFEEGMGELMADVIAGAAGDRRRFSFGQNMLKYGGGVTVYGMAQCTQDLEESACNQCLETSLEIMSKACGCRDGCRIFGSSCVLRYEIYKFLEDAEVYSPAPEVSY